MVAFVAQEKTGRERDSQGRFLPQEDEDEAATSEAESSAPKESKGGTQRIDASGITAPSIGPNTVIDRRPPEERLNQEQISDTDAMGLDKRREVVGKSYGASVGKQATMYGIFLAVVIGLGFGFKLLADKLDQPPATNDDVAPWSAPDQAQVPVQPIDSPRYGEISNETASGASR